jgi:hypothetical protein
MRRRPHHRALATHPDVAGDGVERVRHWTRSGAVVDPLTGLATPAVLVLRLREVVAHCRSLQLEPAAVYGLGVVDVELAGASPLVRDAARVTVSDHTQRRFASGETLCGCGDRILVLGSATPSFLTSLEALAEDLAGVALLQQSPAQVWVEALPASPELIERFVIDLCS